MRGTQSRFSFKFDAIFRRIACSLDRVEVLFAMELLRTSVGHAEAAEEAARAAGLTNVRIGNRHLLSRDY